MSKEEAQAECEKIVDTARAEYRKIVDTAWAKYRKEGKKEGWL